MASGKGNYLSNKVLNATFNGAAFPTIATVYLALYTVSPGAASASGTEITGVGSYVRKSVTANTTEFPTSSSQQIQNANAQAFVTASSSWGTIVAAAIYDASTTGNELYFGDLTASKTVGSGDTAQFNALAITVTEA